VHGCTIEDDSLIGIGAVILDGAVIGRESLVAAGAVVSPGKTYPPRSLIMGVPAKVVRTMTVRDVEEIRTNAVHYIEKAAEFRKERESESKTGGTENS
jgi:carbonic anhydrase/acetyltransferase-like protein (isoleucine patch superfamily)